MPDENEPWMLHAACRDGDADLWFPARFESVRPAKKICAACPVRQPCLDYAQRNVILHGVWGGLTPRERRLLRVTRRLAS